MTHGYTIDNRKITIIGAGYVGSSIAYALSIKDVAREIVLVDINHEKTDGEANDIRHGLPSMGKADVYAGDYLDCKDSDLIIITAGRGRKPGESRLDLANENAKIMKNVIDNIKKYYTRGVILVVSNPVDILTYKATEWMGLPRGMVFGTGCILDSSRFVRLTADHLGISTGYINGYVIGEHGDGQVPVWSKVTVAGMPIEDFCKENDFDWNEEIKNRIEENTRVMGASIIKGKGRTHYGIATCVCQIAEAIINMRPIIGSVSSAMDEIEGFEGVALSVPSIIGPAGVQHIFLEELSAGEYERFCKAAEKIRNTLKSIDDVRS